MAAKPYGREHALALLEPTGLQGEWTVDDQGLWPKAEFKQLHAWGLRHEYELAAWKPASVYADASDAPDLIKTPALPFPFDGSDLAAFMLAGFGCLLADFYGDWTSGPDEFQLSRIDPGNNFARRAVKEAFDAYRKAVEKVGGRDSELDRRASEACEAYSEARDEALVRHDTQAVAYPSPGDSDERRREMNAEYTRRIALVNAELVALDEERERLQVENEAAEKKWLAAMVACLLQTKPQAVLDIPTLTTGPASPALPEAPSSTFSGEACSSDKPGWTVRKPERFVGYSHPLFRLLTAAHREGKSCPTAYDVLEEWRKKQPGEIAKVLPDGVDYYEATGNVKSASLDAIRKAIRRMTAVR